MRVLRITAKDGKEFYSRDWSFKLVDHLEAQCVKRHDGIERMELLQMTEEQYNAIPATMESAELFRL